LGLKYTLNPAIQVRKKINSLEEELKNGFEHLEMIYKTSSCNEVVSCKPTKCENCEVLQDKTNYLMKTIARLILGTENLNVILGSQKANFTICNLLILFEKRPLCEKL